MADTGLKSPSATGEDYNQWSNPTNAYSSNNVYTVSTITNEKQDYYNFTFGITSSATIDGIEVRIEASENFGGTTIVGVELSYNGGTNYTSTGYNTGDLTSTDTTYTLGGSTNTWGRTWTDTELGNTNFRLRINTNNPGFYNPKVDHIQVIVYYTEATGTNMSLNIGDTWKAISAMQINIGDSWKAVASAKINIGDTWKTIY
jgi:hypothetical protein